MLILCFYRKDIISRFKSSDDAKIESRSLYTSLFKTLSKDKSNLRFHKSIKKIKKLLTDKEIGDILWIRAESSSYLPDWHLNDDYRKSYASKKITGGGVVLTCIHELD